FDGNCTWASNSVSLTNFPTPVPTLADTGACTGTPLVLAVEPGLVNIVWSDATTGTSVTVLVDGTYYYTAEDVNGCQVVSDTASVTFLPAPTVNLTTDDDTICAGATTVLRANATGTALSYNWSPIAGNADTLVVNQGGTYYVTVSNGFCPVVDSVSVFQLPSTPAVTNNDTSVCPGQDVVVSVAGTYDTYQWNNGAQTQSFTTDTVGSYWVVVTQNGCTFNSDTFTLSNFTVPQPALADTGACTGESVTLTAEAGLTNVVWSLGPNGPTLTVTGPGDYWYTAEDANGCSVTSDTSTVTFAPAPVVNLTATADTFCLGRTTTLNPNAVGTNLTYSWLPGGDTTSTLTVNTAGTYVVTVSNGFCPTSDTITVYQFTSVPVTLIADEDTICPGTSVTVAASGGPYVSYNWFPSGTTPTIQASAPGIYYVVVNDGNCTYTSDTFTLSNFTVVTPVATPASSTVCENTPVTLSGDAGYTGYLWSPGNLPGQTVTVNNAGTYSFTATDANSCTVTSTTATVIYTAPPSSTINPAAAVLCPNSNGVTLYSPGDTGVVYTWTPGPVVNDSFVATVAGTYTLTASIGTCQSSSTATVTAGALPVFNVDAYTSSCCTEVALTATGVAAGSTYTWNDGNSNISNNDTLYVASTNNDTAFYSLTVTNADGCSATQTDIAVRINCIQPTATASPDSVLAGQTSQLTVLTAYNDVTFTYAWTPGSTLDDSTIANPTASPLEETVYTVYVTDPNSRCMDSTTVSVFIQFGEKFKVPNAFSPNGDGKNDNFYPVLLGAYQSVTEFRIYNRWGALVHNNTDPWDGNFNGAMQPAGTFVYYLTVRVPDDANIGQTKDVKVSGSFTLLH
ncbi:MAG: gliding motility-associated C-terminal domain-containing protein, partial [Bacteroidetes bacterium]|nr:gliding motility-associated C-terminal domain-containing protein [Bacteroidota bacterium]